MELIIENSKSITTSQSVQKRKSFLVEFFSFKQTISKNEEEILKLTNELLSYNKTTINFDKVTSSGDIIILENIELETIVLFEEQTKTVKIVKNDNVYTLTIGNDAANILKKAIRSEKTTRFNASLDRINNKIYFSLRNMNLND
jgi:sporulation protein YlmC with PRC-barrel domain